MFRVAFFAGLVFASNPDEPRYAEIGAALAGCGNDRSALLKTAATLLGPTGYPVYVNGCRFIGVHYVTECVYAHHCPTIAV